MNVKNPRLHAHFYIPVYFYGMQICFSVQKLHVYENI